MFACKWARKVDLLHSLGELMGTIGTAQLKKEVCLCLLKTCLFWQQNPEDESCHLQYKYCAGISYSLFNVTSEDILCLWDSILVVSAFWLGSFREIICSNIFRLFTNRRFSRKSINPWHSKLKQTLNKPVTQWLIKNEDIIIKTSEKGIAWKTFLNSV